MAVSYILVDSIIVIVLTGVIHDRELLDAQQELFDDPSFVGDYPRLVDATHVSQMLLSARVVRHVAKSAYDRGMRKAAFVANKTQIVYGLVRMYAEYTGDARVEVFHDREAAIEWLRDDVTDLYSDRRSKA